MGPEGVTEKREGRLNGEGDVEEMDDDDGGEEVDDVTEGEPEIALFHHRNLARQNRARYTSRNTLLSW